MEYRDIEDLARRIGFEHVGKLKTSSLEFRDDVRRMCARDRCDRYNTSWSCPPRIGGLDVISRKAEAFSEGILIQTTYDMDGRFDLESIGKAERLHKDRFQTLVRQLKNESVEMLPMSSGTCTLCRKCTYPTRPCRHPEKVFPSMEAYGLMVRDVCEASGLKYNYGTGKMTYTSRILYK